MTKLKWITALSSLVMITIIIQSCTKGNETNISAHNQNESHNMGQNCMNCHRSGGEGKGWFNVAGTVYNATATQNVPNATVYLYTGPNGTGTLQYTVEVDAKGNFFTTEAIDFGTGLYPSIQGNTTTKHMSTSITTGACNSCHTGTSTPRLWTE